MCTTNVFISPRGLAKAASHSTCTAYCKGSPTVQVLHIHLGHQQCDYTTHTNTHTDKHKRCRLVYNLQIANNSCVQSPTHPVIPKETCSKKTHHLCPRTL